MLKEIVMPMGLPGIGKSTWLKSLMEKQPGAYLGSDAIRKEITGDEADVSKDALVKPLFHQRFAEMLKTQTPSRIFLDATFLKAVDRQPFLETMRQAIQQGQQLVLKVFEFPMDLHLALQRQANRSRQVPEYVIRGMLQKAVPFSLAESQGIPTEHHRVDAGGQLNQVA